MADAEKVMPRERPEVPYYNPDYVNAVRAMEKYDVLVWVEDAERFFSMIDKLRYLRKKLPGRDWHGFISNGRLFVVRTL